MEKNYSDITELDIGELISTLLRKWRMILLAGILVATGSFLISTYLIEPVYVSSTKVYVINRQDANKMTLSDLQTGMQLTRDYMVLVKSRSVLEQVIERLSLPISQEELSNIVQVIIPQDTRILEINVSYTDPSTAKQIADAFAEISSEHMVRVMEIEKVNIIESGYLPLYPSRPSVLKNTMNGALIGSFLMCIGIILYNILNDSIKTPEDIEKYLDLTTLGTIPFENLGSIKKRLLKNEKRKRRISIAS